LDAVFNLLLRCGLDTWTPWLLHPVMIPTNFLQSSSHKKLKYLHTPWFIVEENYKKNLFSSKD
jgi:hypothetical protein